MSYKPSKLPEPWSPEWLKAQIKASLELEFVRREVKVEPQAIETLINLYTARIKELEEQLEYEKLKADAYRMVWSAREYLFITDNENYSARRVLSTALDNIDFQNDYTAIREKYNPKVVKLKKRDTSKSPVLGAAYGQGGAPDTGVVFDGPSNEGWIKHWHACDIT
jgi:hypothetical protein